MSDTQQISDFYSLIRDYWAGLTRFQSVEETCMLNFGYWSDGVQNLRDAQHAFVRQIVDALPVVQGPVEGLEIGCGIGGISIQAIKLMPEVHLTGLDISATQLSMARANAEKHGVASRFTPLQGDAMAMPIADASFDFSLCIESSFHYRNKAKFIRECYRTLRRGSTAVIADITCIHPEKIRYRDGNYFEAPSYYLTTALEAGFEITSVRDIGPQVYQSLYAHILAFNTHERSKVGKYWSLVLNNYRALANSGEMGYQIFVFRKPH